MLSYVDSETQYDDVDLARESGTSGSAGPTFHEQCYTSEIEPFSDPDSAAPMTDEESIENEYEADIQPHVEEKYVIFKSCLTS